MAHKIIYGCVNKDGSTKAGAGYDCKRTKEGMYSITFRPEFNSMPAVVLTQNHKEWDSFDSKGGDTRDNCAIVALDKGECKVVTGNSKGKYRDRNFTFIAVEE